MYRRRKTEYYLDGARLNRAPSGFGAGTKSTVLDTPQLLVVRIDYCRQNASPRKRERLARAGVPLP